MKKINLPNLLLLLFLIFFGSFLFFGVSKAASCEPWDSNSCCDTTKLNAALDAIRSLRGVYAYDEPESYEDLDWFDIAIANFENPPGCNGYIRVNAHVETNDVGLGQIMQSATIGYYIGGLNLYYGGCNGCA